MTDTPWIEIRNSAGHLLFRYNPYSNEIELRLKGVTYELIKLDEIRNKYVRTVEMIADSEALETIVIPEQRRNGNEK